MKRKVLCRDCYAVVVTVDTGDRVFMPPAAGGPRDAIGTVTGRVYSRRWTEDESGKGIKRGMRSSWPLDRFLASDTGGEFLCTRCGRGVRITGPWLREQLATRGKILAP